MTTVSDAFPSNYLKATDLNKRAIKLKIDKVVFEEIGQDKDKKPILLFVDVKKGLVLNKTNATTIGSIHGQELELEVVIQAFCDCPLKQFLAFAPSTAIRLGQS